MTDESEGGVYRFTFCCDICGSPWQSNPFHSDLEGTPDSRIRESEYNAAYERANREAMNWFSRCPVCKRFLCDKCFRILEEQDMCVECADTGNC